MCETHEERVWNACEIFRVRSTDETCVERMWNVCETRVEHVWNARETFVKHTRFTCVYKRVWPSQRLPIFVQYSLLCIQSWSCLQLSLLTCRRNCNWSLLLVSFSFNSFTKVDPAIYNWQPFNNCCVLESFIFIALGWFFCEKGLM
jgi:hypothetical protein